MLRLKNGIVAVGNFNTKEELKKLGKIKSSKELTIKYYGKRTIGEEFIIQRPSGQMIVVSYYNGFWSQTGINRDCFQETTAVLAIGDLKMYNDVSSEYKANLRDDGVSYISFI